LATTRKKESAYSNISKQNRKEKKKQKEAQRTAEREKEVRNAILGRRGGELLKY